MRVQIHRSGEVGPIGEGDCSGASHVANALPGWEKPGVDAAAADGGVNLD